MDKNLLVEISLRLKGQPVPPCFDGMEDKICYRSDEKVLYAVPVTWEGFKNGLAWEMIKTGRDIGFFLSYYAQESNITVTDFDGREVNHFDVLLKGTPATKYVKRTLMVLRAMKDGAFEMNAYALNLDQVDPVVEVLAVRCSNAEGLRCGLNAFTLLSREQSVSDQPEFEEES